MRLSQTAPAKVNLFLHVGPPDGDGYHPVESLVVFADVGDVVTLTPAGATTLAVTGPFAAAVDCAPGDNLIERVLGALERAIGRPARFAVLLDKRLPVAAGLGGGSADAGAVLRLAARALGLDADHPALVEAASAIGADGPMCLASRPSWAAGRGELLTHELRLPALAAVLVNPGRPSPTGAVYRAYDADPRPLADRPDLPSSWAPGAVIEWLGESSRNDLEAPAVGLEPAIGEALSALRATSTALVRMSGSGATAFGLYPTFEEARVAAEGLAAERPEWWIQATVLNVSGDQA